jgi:hypothetical protein
MTRYRLERLSLQRAEARRSGLRRVVSPAQERSAHPDEELLAYHGEERGASPSKRRPASSSRIAAKERAFASNVMSGTSSAPCAPPPSRTHATFRARLLLVVYAGLAVALALFALSVIRPPAAKIDETDTQNNTYEGTRDVVNGDFTGPVRVSFADGARYAGVLEEGGFVGQATYIGVGDWTLSGVFTNGYLEGEGYYADNIGSYEGAFTHSLPDGKGIYRSVQGWQYEGDFRNGEITGQGILTFDDGSTLEGAFESGAFREA